MIWSRRILMQILTAGAAVGVLTVVSAAGVAQAMSAGGGWSAALPLGVKAVSRLPDGNARLASASPTGLPPTAIASVYHLPGLSASSGAGAGQIIAIVDAYDDPNALSDLNAFSERYGYPQLPACVSLSRTAPPCFEKAYAQGSKPAANSHWAMEESLDIEWAHAEAPAAKVVLVEARIPSSKTDMFGAVSYANTLGATEVSMSWYGKEFSGERSYDSDMTHPGTFYTAAAGDSGHEAAYPAASPDVIAVGGTTLNGCGGTSCADFTSETAWRSSGGGTSVFETIPDYQRSYKGPVSGAASISALTGGKRAIPDVSFDASLASGVSVYDSTPYKGQSGWFTLYGTSVGAPNWAGILAAAATEGSTALQGDSAIYSGGYAANLRDITAGTNGECGAACTAASGYDQVTGLGSPSYPVASTWGSAEEVPGTAALNVDGNAAVNSVSCASAGNCSAGGSYADSTNPQFPDAPQAFIISEVNGTWGTATEVPGTATLDDGGAAVLESVSCASAGNCSAGGYYGNGGSYLPFVVSQVGGTWGTAQQVPGIDALNDGDDSGVDSVSCASAGNCSAGGDYTDASGGQQAFVVSQVNGTWGTAEEVPGTAALNAGGDAFINSVSCASAGNCSAGGDYTDGSGGQQVFVASEADGTWGTATGIPGMAVLNDGGAAVVDSVSCASAGNCSADGEYHDGSGHQQAFVASEVNGTWGTATEVPGTAALNKNGYAAASSVSCSSAGSCSAGGYYADGSGHQQAFIVSEVNGTWGTATEVPGIAALNMGSGTVGRGAAVSSVSCSSDGNCSAGGYYTDSPDLQ
jgi:hypothetical protein